MLRGSRILEVISVLLQAPGPVLHDVGRGVDVVNQRQEEAGRPVSELGACATGKEAVDQLGQSAV